MSQEIVYTYAKQGLDPDQVGFCAVASTPEMSPRLTARLESLSDYQHVYPSHGPDDALNPVNFSHLTIKAGKESFHVLSRVGPAGLDYSRRSNKLAHHVVLNKSELTPGGPAWALAQPDFCIAKWDKPPRIIPSGRLPCSGQPATASCNTWAELAGDAGWGGVLAQTAMDQPRRPVVVIFRPGQSVLPLVVEAINLLPHAKRWGVTFSTFFSRLPPRVDCQWKFLVDGTREASRARRNQRLIVIDLCQALGSPTDGRFVDLARTDQQAVSEVTQEHSSTPFERNRSSAEDFRNSVGEHTSRFAAKSAFESGLSLPLATLPDRVFAVLAGDTFRQASSGFDRRMLIRLANSVGGPRMRLLHWKRLIELRRIPHSDEKEAVDAIAGINRFGADKVEIFMVSHRWLNSSLDRQQSRPDNVGHQKANALNEFSHWRREWVLNRHHFRPQLYYWIDYSCIDQNRAEEAVPLLPIWTACCERFLRIETTDYDERMWCRLEPLLSYVYSFTDHQLSIGLDFECRWPSQGISMSRAILDPRKGQNTDPRDMRLISPLVELAIDRRPANESQEPVVLAETKVKCFKF